MEHSAGLYLIDLLTTRVDQLFSFSVDPEELFQIIKYYVGIKVVSAWSQFNM